MAYYRKNKKRFDPRYFMDEKMEDPLNEDNADRGRQQIPLDAPGWTEEDEKRQKQHDKKKNKNPRDVPRGSADIDFTMQEDLSHLADPATWNILALAAGKMFSIWAPIFGIAGFVAVIRDALEFLKDNPKPSAQEAEDAILAASKAKSKKGEEEEWPEDDRDLLAMQYDADDTQQAWRDSIEEVLQTAMGGATGINQQAAGALYDLVDPRIEKSMKKIKDNSIHLGDIRLLKNLVRNREDITEEQKNLIRILNVLAGTQDQWADEQSWESDEQEDAEV